MRGAAFVGAAAFGAALVGAAVVVVVVLTLVWFWSLPLVPMALLLILKSLLKMSESRAPITLVWSGAPAGGCCRRR